MKKLLVTDECGRLARWLRLMGHDVECMAAQPLSALYRRAYDEGRTIITRNHRVRAGQLLPVVRLSQHELQDQLRHVMKQLGLTTRRAMPFTRCDRCNVPVRSVERALVKELVPPYVFETQRAFRRCPSCRRIYWPATHCRRIQEVLDRVSDDLTPPATCRDS